nr:hypothetical protein [uncultured Draconibacterium sp.]
MKNFFLIGLLIIMTISCEKDSNEPNPEIINGIWVETLHKSDTLVFDNESSYFTLNRGTVMTATGISTIERQVCPLCRRNRRTRMITEYDVSSPTLTILQ